MTPEEADATTEGARAVDGPDDVDSPFDELAAQIPVWLESLESTRRQLPDDDLAPEIRAVELQLLDVQAELPALSSAQRIEQLERYGELRDDVLGLLARARQSLAAELERRARVLESVANDGE